MTTQIVSGYIIDPNDLEHFIRRLLGDDETWLAENNDANTHYRLLVQWLRTLPKEERVASVQCNAFILAFSCPPAADFMHLPVLWTRSSDVLACIITGIAEHPNSRARIGEDEKQQKTRDRFLDKANAAAGTSVLAAERTRYFSCREACLGGHVGDCYVSYPDRVTTQRKANEAAVASSSPAHTAPATPTTSASAN
ncbi:hypothetical protein EVG20_g7434 [Dentipellis fragilis]|uniref:Uncharacterized protein n=1 Tax=Dentipellis fragilis TaxID=205917 RepID=A0A4Y9YHI0_9AGAM|nr:hypothetical protein EVG20_g7434 [Dentipellis fragilis]